MTLATFWYVECICTLH